MATRVVARPQPRNPKAPEPVGAAMTISAEAKKRYDAGRAAYDRNDFDVAIREFEAAIRLESRFVDAIIDLGDAYFDSASVEEAVDAYQRALVVDKGNLDAQFRLGRASYARRHTFPHGDDGAVDAAATLNARHLRGRVARRDQTRNAD
jgi:tetratricopeptide (TPR) repeat protein